MHFDSTNIAVEIFVKVNRSDSTVNKVHHAYYQKTSFSASLQPIDTLFLIVDIYINYSLAW